MWRQLSFILPLIAISFAIKVPVDPVNSQEDTSESTETPQNTSVYYAADDANIDSYLVPPDPHKPEEVDSDIVTPATYLVPPSPNKQTDYYYPPTEPGDQSEWYPIPAQQEVPEVKQKVRSGKGLKKARISVPVPSDHLEPPVVDAQSDYIVPIPSDELELPLENQRQQFVPEESDYPNLNEKRKFSPVFARDGPVLIRINPQEQIISPHLLPPKGPLGKFKNPTKLYPKKFPGTFKPIPIPIAQFAEDSVLQVPRAKPLKYYQPIASDEATYLNPAEEKQRYLYEQAELKRKLKEEEAAKQQQAAAAVDTYGGAAPAEQETSATLHGHPGRPVPLRQAPVAAPAASSQNESGAPPPSDDRTEFRMHGMKGPHSYQFGYDTGKGKNRQFRYEERDNDGSVRGHYGYMDKHGKLRVVNYRAHPEHGFQADAAIEKE